MQPRRAALAAFALVFAFVPAQSRAQQIPATPAPPAPYVSIEEEVSPNYDDESGSSSLVNLRGQLPYAAGAQYVVRLKLPIVTSAPATAVTAAGDLALYDLAVTDVAGGRWLEGATIRVPTAQNDSLGSGKYSIGPAFGYETQHGPWTFGFFQQSFFSVIGPTSRSPVGQSKVEPAVTLALARGWSIGLSSMTITYDWVRNEWTEVPVGVRVAKQFNGALSPLEASVEMEQNLADAKGAPGWTIRTLLKWTLPR
ncbi:MAG: hypothetical protein WA215_02420 [Candidatus Cybelea sp.]